MPQLVQLRACPPLVQSVLAVRRGGLPFHKDIRDGGWPGRDTFGHAYLVADRVGFGHSGKPVPLGLHRGPGGLPVGLFRLDLSGRQLHEHVGVDLVHYFNRVIVVVVDAPTPVTLAVQMQCRCKDGKRHGQVLAHLAEEDGVVPKRESSLGHHKVDALGALGDPSAGELKDVIQGGGVNRPHDSLELAHIQHFFGGIIAGPVCQDVRQHNVHQVWCLGEKLRHAVD
mmetsp:Transcript_4875/g.12552  ORF Transcript_4875/g.12552 Transcript_4875/m.12552 type:complete len:226 (+) Transcript_4875:1142-1819(+)